MIVLDTNVLSELLRVDPDPGVGAWVEAQPPASLFTTAVTSAELRFGLAILPRGARRQALQDAVSGILEEDFAGRVLPFDEDAAQSYAAIAAARRETGQPISQFDAQIAAIAHSRGARLATRNVRDFVHCGVEVIDPWAS
jgi:predicted nucleic acid-binding protein